MAFEMVTIYNEIWRGSLFTSDEVESLTDDEFKLYDALQVMGLRETCLIIAALPNDRMGPNE